MKTNKVKTTELKTIQQRILPTGFIERVRNYKNILEEVETSSLEEAVSNFQRDMNPEIELSIWEEMARIYTVRLESGHIQSISDKKRLFAEILTASFSGTLPCKAV